jgi:hypothetical protein
MGRLEDHIPPNILAAAKSAGLKGPDWYAGRSHDPNHQRKKTLEDIAREVGERLAAAATDARTETEDQTIKDEKA